MVIRYPVKVKIDSCVCSSFHCSPWDFSHPASHPPFLDAQACCPCGRTSVKLAQWRTCRFTSRSKVHLIRSRLFGKWQLYSWGTIFFYWLPIILLANALLIACCVLCTALSACHISAHLILETNQRAVQLWLSFTVKQWGMGSSFNLPRRELGFEPGSPEPKPVVITTLLVRTLWGQLVCILPTMHKHFVHFLQLTTKEAVTCNQPQPLYLETRAQWASAVVSSRKVKGYRLYFGFEHRPGKQRLASSRECARVQTLIKEMEYCWAFKTSK